MKRLITVFLLIALCPLQACMWYSAEAIEAWVVDAETNKPIEGVIVVAHWQLYGGLHPDDAGELTILETVTDKAGRFHFPAWGPKFANARLAWMDPEILLFKSGFKYERIANELIFAALSDMGPSLRRSRWNGKTIKMEKFEGSLEKYLGNFTDFNRVLEEVAVRDPKECNWKKLPHSIRTISLERKRLESLRIRPYGISTIDERLLANDIYYIKEGGCGSPKEFFGGFQ